MSEQEIMLIQLKDALRKVARPYAWDQALPVDVQASLWRLGVPCDEATPREELVAQLWARQRSLQMAVHSPWGGPGSTPPSAA